MKSKKTKIFLSYSRKDRASVAHLYDALNAQDEIRVFRDTNDILPTEEWKPRLEKLIRESDMIVFALSPSSAVSTICAWEIELAESLNKRIIPVVVDEVDGNVPESISKLNYIFLTEKDSFGEGLAKIQDSLSLDIDWIREHTRLGELAERWEKTVRLGAQPLRGRELEEAETWLAKQPPDAPAPTRQQREYILASRRAASKRQKVYVFAALVATLVLGAFGAFTWVQRGEAIASNKKAKVALEAAIESSKTMVLEISQDFEQLGVPIATRQKVLESARNLQETLFSAFDENDPELIIAKYYLLEGTLDSSIDVGDVNGTEMALTAFENHLNIAVEVEGLEKYAPVFEANRVLVLYQKARIAGSRFNFPLERELMGEVETRSTALFEKYPKVAAVIKQHASGLFEVGRFHANNNDFDAATKLFERAIPLLKRIAKSDKNEVIFRTNLALAYSSLCESATELENIALARSSCNEARMIMRDWLSDNPRDYVAKARLRSIFSDFVTLETEVGSLDLAAKYANDMFQLASEIHLVDEENAEAAFNYAVAAYTRAQAFAKLDEPPKDQIIADFELSIRILEQLIARRSENVIWLKRRANFQMQYAVYLHFNAGDQRAALAVFETTCENAEIYAKSAWNDASSLEIPFLCFHYKSDLEVKLGDMPAAIESRKKRLNFAIRRLELEPNNVGFKRDLAKASHSSAQGSTAFGTPEEQDEALKRALDLYEDLATSKPFNGADSRKYVEVLGISAKALDAVDPVGAQGMRDKALSFAKLYHGAVQDDPEMSVSVAGIHKSIGAKLVSAGDMDGALEQFDLAILLHEEMIQSEGDPFGDAADQQTFVLTEKMRALRQIGDNEQALEIAKSVKAVREVTFSREPDSESNLNNLVYIYRNIAYILNALGQYNEAAEAIMVPLDIIEEAASRGVTAETSPSNLKISRVWYLELAGDFAEALPLAKELRDAEQSVPTLVNYGNALLYTGDFDAAMLEYQTCVDMGLKSGGKECRQLVIEDLRDIGEAVYPHLRAGEVESALYQ